MIFGSVYWDVDPVLFDFGIFSLRYYTLFFAVGILLVALLAWFLFFKKEKMTGDAFLNLFYYSFFGIVIGARLGHCLFYEPVYFLSHPWEIILPFHVIDGQVIVTGYQGLASHGGLAGGILGLYLFCRNYGFRMLNLLDQLAIVAPLGGAFIRLGNLMNSEIVGEITNVPWAFRFSLLDGVPRHPAQLYEAMAYLSLFCVNLILYRKRGDRYSDGFFLGLSLFWIFSYRFCIEFFKIHQVPFEEQLRLNVGQLLSIPYILAGIYFLFIYPHLNREADQACKSPH